MIETTMQQADRLWVIIPALNEAQTIGRVIKNIPTELKANVLVVNDGSKDETVIRAQEAGATVISHRFNRGVGAAFQTGLREALSRGASLIINIDADGQFNPADIPKLIKPIKEGRAEFVTATRFAKPELIPRMPLIKRLGNKGMVYLINFITGQNFTDVSCGFRAYTREAALKLTLFGAFTYTQETFIDLSFKKVAMLEVPLKIRGEREFGKSRVASNLWRYGTKAFAIIFRTARDYLPHYFFGIPGLASLLLGLLTGFFLIDHYLATGQTSPYRSLVQLSAVLIIVGFLLLFLSMLADMLRRNRIIMEETLYLARKRTYRRD